MTAILGRTGNLVGFTTGRGTTPWNTEMESALRKQDALLATTVQAITNTLPASASEGDLFLVGTNPTGVAAGWANRIARWRGSPAGWEAYPPMQGWIVTIVGESSDKVRRYNGTSWAPIGNDVSMGSISGLNAALAAKLDVANPVVSDTLTTKNIKLSDGAAGVGIFRWATDEHVAEITLENGSVLQVGKENVQWCKNETGAIIPNGKLVYVSNSTGDNPVISLASSAALNTSETIGMTTQEIPDGQHGYVAVGVSFVRSLNTATGTPGQAIYLTTAGNYSATAPAKPGRRIRVGFVLRQHASAGIILLWIHTNPSIIDINDADSTGAVTDDVLRLNASGVWVAGKALQVANPTFTGNITGSGSMVWKSGTVSYFSMYAGAVDWGLRDLADDGSLVNYPLVVKRGAAGEIQLGYTGGARPVRVGGAFRIESTLSQGLTERITAGGEGRFAGLRVAGVATGSVLKIADANGQVAAAVANTDYLPVSSPTFSGRLSGNDVKIGSPSSGGWLQLAPNNTGTGTFSLDFLGGTSSNRRMTIRWSDVYDNLIVMTSNDDGSARLDRVLIPRSSSLPITVAGGATINGGLRAQTAVDSSSFQWTPDANEGVSFFGSTSVAGSGFGYHSLVVHSNDSEAAGRNLGGLSFGQKVSGKSGGYPGLKAFVRGETYGSGGSVGGFGGRVVIAARGDNASSPSDVVSFDTTKVALSTGIPLYQGATERITAGGDGRFASLRASGLVASSTYLTRLDANGELVASSIKEDLGDIGNVGTFRTVFGRIVLLTSGYGTWTSGANYDSWGPSIVCPVSDDTLANGSGATPSGGIWNSQRLNALTITDGAAATPYRGRIRADRWFATSFLQIQNTTTATSWFAAGTGDGSPTLPANYLKSGRRVRIHGRIFCPSNAVNSNPEIVLKVGGTTIFTVSKQFTMAAGNEIVITIKADMFIDDSNRLIVIGEQEFYAFASGMYAFKANGQIDPYAGTSSKTIDITIKPSSTSETWIRSLAFIEA